MASMKLNDWWRLWIVISVCWTVAVTVTVAPSVDAFRSRTALAEFDNGSGGKTKVRVAVSRALSEEQVREQVERGEIGTVLSKDLNNNTFQTIIWPHDKYISHHALTQLKRTLILILIPIFATLLLGVAIAWIREGFCRSEPVRRNTLVVPPNDNCTDRK